MFKNPCQILQVAKIGCMQSNPPNGWDPDYLRQGHQGALFRSVTGRAVKHDFLQIRKLYPAQFLDHDHLGKRGSETANERYKVGRCLEDRTEPSARMSLRYVPVDTKGIDVARAFRKYDVVEEMSLGGGCQGRRNESTGPEICGRSLQKLDDVVGKLLHSEDRVGRHEDRRQGRGEKKKLSRG